jgi:hypothetical protein
MFAETIKDDISRLPDQLAFGLYNIATFDFNIIDFELDREKIKAAVRDVPKGVEIVETTDSRLRQEGFVEGVLIGESRGIRIGCKSKLLVNETIKSPSLFWGIPKQCRFTPYPQAMVPASAPPA